MRHHFASAIEPQHLARFVPVILEEIAAFAGLAIARRLGDADAVSYGDFHLAHNVVYALTGETDGTDERMAELDVNEGIVPLIEMRFPEPGTLLTPVFPAPTNARTFVSEIEPVAAAATIDTAALKQELAQLTSQMQLLQRQIASSRSQAQRLIASGVRWKAGATAAGGSPEDGGTALAWKRIGKNSDDVPLDAVIELLDASEARYV